ncbi:MAG: hypothetical protein ACHQZQ_06635 [SAR324 cluster bacterium]
MKAWKFKAGIVGVFVLGVIVGAIGAGMTLRYRSAEFRFTSQEQVVDRIMSRLSGELNLSDAQQKEIAPIVRDSFTKMRTLRSRLTPQVEALTAETAGRIKQHLDAGQQGRLDAYIAKVLQHWRQFAAPEGPSPTSAGGAADGAPPAR